MQMQSTQGVFVVTSRPGDGHAQNGPELIIKPDLITQSAAWLSGGISSMLQEHARKALYAITTQGYSSCSFSYTSTELLHISLGNG